MWKTVVNIKIFLFFAEQHLEGATSNGFSSEASSEKRSMSSLFDVNFDKDTPKSNKTSSKTSSRRSASPSKTSDGYHGNGESSSNMQDDVHIDSMKKKLLADQIRNRMQSKSSVPSADIFGGFSMGMSSKKRRGRPPKISQDECNLTPKELEVMESYQCVICSMIVCIIARSCDIVTIS